MIWLIIGLGMCLGSFIHVAYCRFKPIYSAYEYLIAISFHRSRCPHCHKQLRFWQLFPVFSWLLLKGQCWACKGKIHYRYIVFEILFAVIFAILFLTKGWTLNTILLMILACYFVLLAMIDLKYYLLPDLFTQPLLWLGILAGYFNLFGITLNKAITGIIWGYFLLIVPKELFYLLTKKQGLGQGDVKLLAALGAWISYEDLSLLLVFSSFLAIVYYLILRYGLSDQSITVIPFGPFLLMSGYLILYYHV